MRAELWRFLHARAAVLRLALEQVADPLGSGVYAPRHRTCHRIGQRIERRHAHIVLMSLTRFDEGLPRSKQEQTVVVQKDELVVAELHLHDHGAITGSLSWTSRTFYFSDSRDLLEVLRGLPWQRERERPRGGSPRDQVIEEPGEWRR